MKIILYILCFKDHSPAAQMGLDQMPSDSQIPQSEQLDF